jgi:hypothetical protein
LNGLRSFRVVFALLAVALVLLLAIVALIQVRSLVQGIGEQTGGRTIDRSGPVILQSVRDLSRYEAASGSFQVVVDLEKDATFLPPAIVGQRTLFVAVGSVASYVDFSRMADEALTTSPDQKTAQVRLPHAALDKPNLDHQHSYVFAQESGIVDRMQSFFSTAPSSQAELYQVAERRIGDAATQSGLAGRAELNTRTMLLGMLRTLGYRQVTVTFG